MLLLVLSLSSLVTSQAGDSTAEGASYTVSSTGAEVRKLSASFLLLTFEILLTTRVLQRLLATKLAFPYVD